MADDPITATADEHREVFEEQVKLLFRGLPGAITTSVFNACILCVVVYPQVGVTTVVVWFSILMVLLAWRGWLTYGFNRQAEIEDMPRWYRKFLFGAVLSGVAWGGACIWLFPAGQSYQVFVAFVLMGMSAGAMTSLSYRMDAFIGFMLPALLPLIINLFLQLTMMASAMGAMAILYLVMIMASARRFNQSYRENILLRIQSNHRERARRESEERYRSVFEHSPIGIMHYDSEGIIIGCNQSFADSIGVTSDELIGLDIYQTVLNADVLAAVRRSLSGENALYHGEYRTVLTDRQLQIQAYYSPVTNTSGDVIGGVVLADDTTERELVKTELQSTQLTLRGVLDTIPVRVFWKDVNGVYQGCNRLFALDTGYSTSEEVIGKTDDDFDWDDELRTYRQSDLDIVKNRRPLLNHLELREFKNGDHRWFEISKVPFYDENGTILGVLCAYQDITERKQADEKTREAMHLAETASRAKSEFLSSMSHELRTPLNAILGFAQILSLEKLEEQQQSYVNHILEGGQHLLGLITQLLDLSRIEAGKLQIDMQPVLLQETVKEAMAMLAPLAEEMQVTIADNITEVSDIWLQADPLRLKQSLINLLSNAVKYNQRSGRVEISMEQMEADRIRVLVEDNGPGIEEKYFDRLFQAFVRVSTSPNQVDGSGIGLPITKYLIEMMGGSIGLTSEVGRGSTFWIELARSIDQAMENTDEIVTIATQPVSNPDAGSHKLRLFYLEDNISNMALVQRLLEVDGRVEAHYAVYPDDGLEKLSRLELDLIMLDINLPEMDGYEVLKRIQNMPHLQQVPVVAISANAMATDISRGLQAGFDDYMTKPLDIPTFQEMLEWHINRINH